MSPATTAVLTPLVERVLAGAVLSRDEAHYALGRLTDANVPDAQKAAFLTALRTRPEEPGELAGLAAGMLAAARGPLPRRPGIVVDTCGTGGDGSGSFNLSTATALLVAALGIPVAKHGNRAVSSRTGSADLVEALGLAFADDPEAAARDLEERGFAFLFAPAFHPAAAGVAPVRRSLGMRTVFNVLGPLANPARPTHQLVGAFSPDAARAMAGALAQLGVERAFCVHGEPGWDEATPVGPFLRVEVRDGEVREATFDPRDYGLERCRPDDLAGGDADGNAALLRGLFDGTRSPLRDALVLNAALVLQLVGREHDPRAAARAAAAALDDGRARTFLEHARRGEGAGR